MPQLRNLGGQYRRATGELVEPGEVFEPGPKEYASLEAERAIGIRFEKLADVEPDLQAQLDAASPGDQVVLTAPPPAVPSVPVVQQGTPQARVSSSKPGKRRGGRR